MFGIVFTAIVMGLAAIVALWSYDPVVAVLCAPFIGSFVAGGTALVLVLIEAAASTGSAQPGLQTSAPPKAIA